MVGAAQRRIISFQTQRHKWSNFCSAKILSHKSRYTQNIPYSSNAWNFSMWMNHNFMQSTGIKYFDNECCSLYPFQNETQRSRNSIPFIQGKIHIH